MRVIKIFICVCFTISAFAQTSDISKGCIPLVVNFEAPAANSYYWDFGDGGDSEMQNPEHIFTSDGIFTVSLYTDASKSDLIGTVEITVYPDLIIEIDADQKEGCIPREINFTSDVTRHPDVVIEGYLWTFGNGASSEEKDPSYNYEIPGLFDISLEVTTNLKECDKTIIIEDMIDLFEYQADIQSDKTSSCEYPATFTFTNLSQQDPDLSYEWEVNGEIVSTEFNIDPITIDEPDIYVVVFRMETAEGCKASDVQTLLVGSPLVDLVIDEVSCPGEPLTLINNSSGSSHFWDFGEGAEPMTSSEANPVVTYTTEGPRTIFYRNAQGVCVTDTFINILITDDFATFTVTPETICGDSIVYTLTADFDINGSYCWNGETTPGEQVHYVTRITEERDPEHVNEIEVVEFSLEIKLDNGCVANYSYTFEAQLPEAFFIPDSVIGVAPLTIGFEDRSTSSEPIVKRIWKFGDSTIMEVDTSITYVTHTFTDPGEYCVELCIEDEAGCTDVSKTTCITVLDPNGVGGGGGNGDVEIVIPDGGGGGGGGPSTLCVGQSINLSLNMRSPGLEDIFITDDHRFVLCWRDSIQRHTFRYPGEFPIIHIREKDGFEITRDTLGSIEVVGARAVLAYEMNCTDNQEIFLKSNSLNAQRIQWYHNGSAISEEDSLLYNLADTGLHEIVLEAFHDDDNCSHTDTAIVYVAEPLSSFTVEDKICDNILYLLDGSDSNGAKEPCSNSYRWDFEFQRPRAVEGSELFHLFTNGKQDVTLTVTDINGCTHSSTENIDVYGTELGYEFPELICLPHEQTFQNMTTSDTTIVSWDWNFGSSEVSPDYTFTEADSLLVTQDTLEIILTTEDALGCRDSLVTSALIFDPESEIILPDELICENAPIEIFALDYTEQNVNLLYNWDFASGGTSTDRVNEEVSFTSDGLQTIQLIIQPKGLFCIDTLTAEIDVLPAPNADFISSVDSLETICYPATIEFTNTSMETGSTSYAWDLGNGSTSTLEDPASSFDRGMFTIRLTATSTLGCKGVQEKTLDIVGPDGDIILDKENICLGEDVTAQLINQTDVSEWQWDMGDGTVYADQETVTHTYTFVPPDNENKIEVVLKSTATGCEVVKSLPLNINEVIADFELEEGLNYCEGLARFENLSTGGSIYLWDFGTEQSSDSDPTILFDENGDKLVTLTVTDPQSGCSSMISRTISITGEDTDIYEFPNVFSPNGDGRNDLFRAIIPPGLEEVIRVTDFKVFDKWGQLLFDNDTPQGWDGNFSGDQMPSDVYAFYIEIDVQDCKVVNDKGNVTLIR